MKRVAFYTLGCKLNFAETSSISRLFTERGYQKVAFHEQPHIVVVNTCSVTDNAVKNAGVLLKMHLKFLLKRLSL